MVMLPMKVLLIVGSIAAVQSAASRPPTKVPTFAPTSAPTYDYSCVHATSWLVNTNGQYSNKYSTTVDVSTSGFVNTTTSTTGWKATWTGIPFYGHVFTTEEVDKLNSRPDASTDFTTGQTTAVAGTYYEFGADIGYESSQCTDGYWPSGPSCPAAYNGTYTFPVFPSPEINECYVTAHVGYFVNGVPFWSWSDTTTYNSEGVWYSLAMKFEQYDMDVCVGHSAKGTYHHHSVSPCLMTQLNDTGHGHSPVHGFAYDGYPVYGPYQAANTLAVSCWQARDYSSAATGCSGGGRTCTFVDPYDYTQGTETAAFSGPDPSGTVATQSSQTISAASGCYFQDFFYNSTCSNLGAEYLDSHNGHSHGSYGYHYHVTMDSTSTPTFPYTMGPQYYGCLPNGGNCQTGISSGVKPSSCTTTPTQKAGACTKYEYSPAISYPTMAPTTSFSPTAPTRSPTANPTTPTVRPSKSPSAKPTTIAPSAVPTTGTTASPSNGPSLSPSIGPTLSPSQGPSVSPSMAPSRLPTITPSLGPTAVPSVDPSAAPSTLSPSMGPTTLAPSVAPTVGPSLSPTKGPSLAPSMQPTISNPPTESPTTAPSHLPTIGPSASPTVLPTLAPSQSPSEAPTLAPTLTPTLAPSAAPSEAPTTTKPSSAPSVRPSRLPSVGPTARPSPGPGEPTYNPTLAPSPAPSQAPSYQTAPILSFTTSTTLSGLTSDSLDSAAQTAFVNATATSLGVKSSYVTYTGSSVMTRRRLLKTVLTTYTVLATTDVSIPMIDFADDSVDVVALFLEVKNSFDTAVSNGAFTQYLTAASLLYGSDSTLDTSVVSYAVNNEQVVNAPSFQPTHSPESSSKSSGVTGTTLYLVVFLVGGGGLLLILVSAYCFMKRGQSPTGGSASPSGSYSQPSQPKAAQTSQPRVASPTPAAVAAPSPVSGKPSELQMVQHQNDNSMGF